VWSKVFADSFRRGRNWISQSFQNAAPTKNRRDLLRWFFVAHNSTEPQKLVHRPEIPSFLEIWANPSFFTKRLEQVWLVY